MDRLEEGLAKVQSLELARAWKKYRVTPRLIVMSAALMTFVLAQNITEPMRHPRQRGRGVKVEIPEKPLLKDLTAHSDYTAEPFSLDPTGRVIVNPAYPGQLARYYSLITSVNLAALDEQSIEEVLRLFLSVINGDQELPPADEFFTPEAEMQITVPNVIRSMRPFLAELPSEQFFKLYQAINTWLGGNPPTYDINRESNLALVEFLFRKLAYGMNNIDPQADTSYTLIPELPLTGDKVNEFKAGLIAYRDSQPAEKVEIYRIWLLKVMLESDLGAYELGQILSTMNSVFGSINLDAYPFDLNTGTISVPSPLPERLNTDKILTELANQIGLSTSAIDQEIGLGLLFGSLGQIDELGLAEPFPGADGQFFAKYPLMGVRDTDPSSEVIRNYVGVVVHEFAHTRYSALRFKTWSEVAGVQMTYEQAFWYYIFRVYAGYEEVDAGFYELVKTTIDSRGKTDKYGSYMGVIGRYFHDVGLDIESVPIEDPKLFADFWTTSGLSAGVVTTQIEGADIGPFDEGHSRIMQGSYLFIRELPADFAKFAAQVYDSENRLMLSDLDEFIIGFADFITMLMIMMSVVSPEILDLTLALGKKRSTRRVPTEVYKS
ncbi:MAG: hypothetical protein JNK26_03180 [Candidatus Doudnabacteria bacterium]|nr:hypothetical protein [Candidatus Doudnabacteria bacterium]